jgi:dTDP-glucose 4,6-dehydratase
MSLNGSLQDIGINPTKVIVYDALTYAGNLNNLKSVASDIRYEFIHGNICDPQILNKIPDDCDLIVNFAAESHVDRSIDGPGVFVKTNILGTQNLLDAAKKKNVKKFVQISTDEVYGSIETGSWDELFPLKPNSPYAASKAAADLISLSYYKTFGVPVIITRCSNNYGYFQNVEKLVPLFINNIRNNKPLPVYGKGENVRDWLYVVDHARAIDVVYHNGKIGETYNIGGFNEWTNIGLIKVICSTMDKILGRPAGESEKLITYVTDRAGHDLRYAIDANKIMKELGWEPSLQFEEGIEKTIHWYMDNQQWMDEVTSGDYANYYDTMYASR